MNQEEYAQQQFEDMEDLQEEQAWEQQQDQLQNQNEFMEAYGAPEPEAKHNQHKFLSDSIISLEPEKVTWLSESELGRPLFNMRFILDMEDICKDALDDIAKELGCENRIAAYFREKVVNISASGMSNKGFIQNLNVTRRMDTTRKRISNLKPQEDTKGGVK